MLGGDNTRKALEAFKDYVISQSRANLTRKNKNVSKQLYNSLKGIVDVFPNSFSLKFEMEDYGKFQDQGVKGATSTYPESTNSPFKFGTKELKQAYSLLNLLRKDLKDYQKNY